ncbi:hypothetical protein ACEWY4_003614 [Coilia grayii]|uniref:UMOD/GP2/OIT3-like D8C domain-containing protein n=1 Tax=Coilia grayii TaxID=363190 RepID=A0ABD1KSV2_9TELE
MRTLLPLLMVDQTPESTSTQERDPCVDHTVLEDPWRATTNRLNAKKCDNLLLWQGWYRLLHEGASTRMPETCVPMNRCGTDIPMWLNGAHPRLEDGIVTREVCGHWYNILTLAASCCHFKPPSIRVKACPGNYTVYELVGPKFCFTTYCMEPGTVFQQRLRLKMVLKRELSHTEMAQFASQFPSNAAWLNRTCECCMVKSHV